LISDLLAERPTFNVSYCVDMIFIKNSFEVVLILALILCCLFTTTQVESVVKGVWTRAEKFTNTLNTKLEIIAQSARVSIVL